METGTHSGRQWNEEWMEGGSCLRERILTVQTISGDSVLLLCNPWAGGGMPIPSVYKNLMNTLTGQCMQ